MNKRELGGKKNGSVKAVISKFGDMIVEDSPSVKKPQMEISEVQLRKL